MSLVRLVLSLWPDTRLRSPGTPHPVDIHPFSYSCMFSFLRLAAAVLFLRSAILLCCGHLSVIA